MVKASGIILKTVPYKERDLIVQVLLEDGHIVSFYAFGGRGGGKKIKPTILEIGNAINFEIENNQNGRSTDLNMAREWSLRWSSKEIKKNFMAFSLMCLCFELILKIMPQSKLTLDQLDEHTGIFAAISNFLFQLDQSVVQKKDNFSLFSFTLGKLIAHLGIKPDLLSCVVCGEELRPSQNLLFAGHQGGFICHHCLSGNEPAFEIQDSIMIYKILSQSFELKFSEWESLNRVDKNAMRKLLSFLAENFQFDLKEINSLSLIF
jgi:DNA repair protein RecO